jgi:hypothetical protein
MFESCRAHHFTSVNSINTLPARLQTARTNVSRLRTIPAQHSLGSDFSRPPLRPERSLYRERDARVPKILRIALDGPRCRRPGAFKKRWDAGAARQSAWCDGWLPAARSCAGQRRVTLELDGLELPRCSRRRQSETPHVATRFAMPRTGATAAGGHPATPGIRRVCYDARDTSH